MNENNMGSFRRAAPPARAGYHLFSKSARFASVLVVGLVTTYGQSQNPAAFLVSNSDAASVSPDIPALDSVVFFSIASDGTLTPAYRVALNGVGGGGGDFAAKRAIVVSASQGTCVFGSLSTGTASTGKSGAVSGISVTAQGATYAGTFSARPTDSGITQSGTSYAIGLAANAQYLYASFAASGTIGTFKIEAGCRLAFIDDVFTVGLAHGWVTGMAIHNGIMVVTYGDGSIESFDISGGTPISNGDVQNSTGFKDNHVPNGVEITRDGHFAIFGDASTVTTVEVSDISTGKLTRTVPYNLGTGWNSTSIRLSPDESELFVSNNSSGQVTAAFFDKEHGKLSLGCTSASLNGFYSTWSYAGSIGIYFPPGTAGYLYVPEFSSHSIGVVQFTSNGKSCILREVANSPMSFINGIGAAPLSVEVYPGHPF